MLIRKSQQGDLESILKICAVSRQFMRENGNPDQWGDDHPGAEFIEDSLKAQESYVVLEGSEIVGTFIFHATAQAGAYDTIEGAWLNDEPFMVISTLATGCARAGVGQCILDWCFEKAGNIRIDTHEDNVPMRRLLQKNGYIYCGKVWYEIREDRRERLAFQKSSR
ncbi:MAG: GNAT family N-acetyltransferase [Coriobacteriales bacterium]|jgi:hypothetical protein|nr:GNAT family N-acetyltransferase [Coriobacteriales bacterium]